MKKRAWILIFSLIVIFQVFNHFCFRTSFFGLAVEIEKLIVLLVTLGFCLYYIRRQAEKTMYSYKIMSNLGIIIFLACCFLFQMYRLIFNFHAFTLEEAYMTVLDSFSQCIIVMMPLALSLAVMLIASNIALIWHDGVRVVNTLGIVLGAFLLVGTLLGPNLDKLSRRLLPSATPQVRAAFYFSQVFWCLVVAYFECMMWAAIICTLMAERHWPSRDRDFMIILGCRVDKNGQPMPILQGRLERALEFAQAQRESKGREITYVPSGGRGSDEVISEAEAMKRYLVAKKVAKEEILLEDRSKTTKENMQFSKQIIDRKTPDAKVVFATTGYHVWRSGVLAESQGLKAEGIGARSPWYFYNNALVREFVANLAVQWQQHLFNLGMILLNVIFLIGVGYYLGIL